MIEIEVLPEASLSGERIGWCVLMDGWRTIGDGPTEEAALIDAEKELRATLDDMQQRLTTARQRVKAAGSPSY